ncbi:glycosyl hydrolase family 28-related protein [uncultured Sphingomonas sp.]|uniref:glycosyl hydrolase family 28-related protein n=1 Tax=uncultured Sphingomonas sp. TaxID=158754 RepID=UPI00260D517E|nr:glycosyl hydrolase family 28-related protein [uncultured Sphingomonas sp.]
MIDPVGQRRHFLIGMGAGAVGSSLAFHASAATSAGRAVPEVNVRDMGAMGDGTTDDTAAFNRATDAAVSWSPALERRIIVPPGRYRIAGTVHIRKGQDFAGSGYATQIDAQRASGSTFVLGRAQGVNENDPGGAPVRISGFRALGSAPRAPFIAVRAEGFSIENLFLSAVGTGIHIQGADGIVRDVIIDQALNGIVFDHAQNVLVGGFYTYLANYAVTAIAACADIAIANSVFCYSRYAAILFAEDGRSLRGLTFTGCSFLQNEQFDSFSGHVQSRASDVDALFTGCQFRNWPRLAIEQGAGRNVALTFSGCVFDALATNPVYTQASTSSGLATGLEGRFRFNACEFRNLRGAVAKVGPGARLAIAGGLVENCQTPLLVVDRAAGNVRVRDVAGFAKERDGGWLAPSWPGAAWRVVARLRDSRGRPVVEEMIVSDDGAQAPVTQHIFRPQMSALEVTLRLIPDRAIVVTAAMGWRLIGVETSTVA